jgi:hypothetical protein
MDVYPPIYTGWWFGTFFIFPILLGMSSSQLTNSYFSEGKVYPQSENALRTWMIDD